MADRVEKVTNVVDNGAAAPAATGEVRQVAVERASAGTLAARIIWWIAGAIIVLLAFRFVLALLGANQGNAFVRFIFDVSRPFVAPFFGILNYSAYQYGVARFEVFTLVAMAVYAVIAWGLARLVTIDRPER